jgi:hypothetical protein|tara:strand:- start:382 stop:507 length:126 start_codon:yes stop_codon:yes gene_type:complete
MFYVGTVLPVPFERIKLAGNSGKFALQYVSVPWKYDMGGEV